MPNNPAHETSIRVLDCNQVRAALLQR